MCKLSVRASGSEFVEGAEAPSIDEVVLAACSSFPVFCSPWSMVLCFLHHFRFSPGVKLLLMYLLVAQMFDSVPRVPLDCDSMRSIPWC
jgi:hypothetical protein